MTINNKVDFQRDVKNTADLAPVVLKRTVTLTAAQLKSLKTSPVELIPSAAATELVLVHHVAVVYRAGTTPFTHAPDGLIRGYYGDPANGDTAFAMDANGIFSEAADQIGFAKISTTSISQMYDAAASFLGKDISLSNIDGVELEDGDGEATFVLFYSVIDLG